MFTSGPDGEYFVDQPTVIIPPKDTWDSLSVKELYNVKTLLETRLYDHQRYPAIARPLAQSLDEISALISSRENASF